MKTDVSQFAFGLVVFWCCFALVQPAAQAQTTVRVLSQASEAGFTVAVPIRLDANQQVVGLQFDLTYSPLKLALGEPSLGADLNGIVLASRRIAPGKRRVLVYVDDLSVLPDTILLNVPGTVPPGVSDASIPITLTAAKASDDAGREVSPLSLLSGVINLKANELISFDSVNVAADGTAFLSFTGVSGKQVALEFTTDLELWVQIGVLQIEDGEIVEVQDREGLRERGFYRARILVP